MRIELRGGGPGFETVERIDVPDHPVASDLDAMQRQWDLERLRDRLGSLRRAHPTPDRKQGQLISRVKKAIATMQGHLAVWKVQQS